MDTISVNKNKFLKISDQFWKEIIDCVSDNDNPFIINHLLSHVYYNAKVQSKHIFANKVLSSKFIVKSVSLSWTRTNP